MIGATWGEVDLPSGVWTVPVARMKAKREHRIPLSPASAAILREAAKLRTGDDPGSPVFPGGNGARGLSNMALLMTLRRMKRADLTAHGFRSTFRDWVGERHCLPLRSGRGRVGAHTQGQDRSRVSAWRYVR